MTPYECKRLQSMDDLKHLPQSSTKAYEALGNAINVEVAKLVAKSLFDTCSSALKAQHTIGFQENIAGLVNKASIERDSIPRVPA